MMKFTAILGNLFVQLYKPISYCIREYQKSKFPQCGKNVYIGKHCIFTPKTMSIGNDVYIGANACMQSIHGKILIGSHVMFGPGVHIHGGNHKIYEIGKLMKETSPKEPDEDKAVVIEDDCWIGANAIILAGVTIGKGCVVGAGAVVVKSIPPYSIYTGVPAMKLRNRFNEEELQIHLKLMEEKRV